MIINIFISLVYTLLTSVFSILPNLPAMPTGITDVLATLLSYIQYGTLMLIMLFGRTFLGIVIPILILLLNFKYVYHFTMWIIRKIPIGST